MPGSAIVVLAATLQAIPAIPAIGLVLVLSVDWFMGIARALGNLIGNCVATVAVAAWEGDIDRQRAHAVLDGKPHEVLDIEEDSVPPAVAVAPHSRGSQPLAREPFDRARAPWPPARPEIASAVVDSILAQKLAPGERLGEQELADLFGVSRTLVREALMQLQARGFVEVRSRKGWYVVEPSIEQARDAFAARRAVEAGMLREAAMSAEGRPLQSVIRRLRQHVTEEQQAIAGADNATRSFLLADFHVCLAECLGHTLLADMLRDLTARTMLVATLYQSTHDAKQSCASTRDRRSARKGRHRSGARADARAHRQRPGR